MASYPPLLTSPPNSVLYIGPVGRQAFGEEILPAKSAASDE